MECLGKVVHLFQFLNYEDHIGTKRSNIYLSVTYIHFLVSKYSMKNHKTLNRFIQNMEFKCFQNNLLASVFELHTYLILV